MGIDYEKLYLSVGSGSFDQLKKSYRGWVEEYLGNGFQSRQIAGSRPAAATKNNFEKVGSLALPFLLHSTYSMVSIKSETSDYCFYVGSFCQALFFIFSNLRSPLSQLLSGNLPCARMVHGVGRQRTAPDN